MPGAAGPAWVLGSSPHGPKLLNGDVQGDNQGSEFFVGKQIQFPCFPKKKKKKSDHLGMCNAPANIHQRCVSESDCPPSSAHSTLFCQIFGLL